MGNLKPVIPEYDSHVDVYGDWSTAENPYRAIESFTFMEVVRSVRDLDIVDLGSGEGRTCRAFVQQGARSVLGTDVSSEMIRRANAKNTAEDGTSIYPNLRYEVLDARDETFALPQPVDLVSAMYLLRYASTEEDLERMCRLIGRTLKPGDRFVTYGVNPAYDHSRREPRLEQQFGVDSRLVSGARASITLFRISGLHCVHALRRDAYLFERLTGHRSKYLQSLSPSPRLRRDRFEPLGVLRPDGGRGVDRKTAVSKRAEQLDPFVTQESFVFEQEHYFVSLVRRQGGPTSPVGRGTCPFGRSLHRMRRHP